MATDEVRLAAVLSDLDGTLLEHGGVLGPEARQAIDSLKARGIPVVPLTSKTELELRDLLAEFGLGEIGGFENGGGVVGPHEVEVSEKAVPLPTLASRLEDLERFLGLRLVPVTSLSNREIRRITGLPEDRLHAMLARRCTLPFLVPEGSEEALEAGRRRLPDLRLTRGGLFWHLSGDHGKEDALDLLLRTGLVARPVAGLGDAPNDAGFLSRCDIAVLVPGPSGTVDPELAAAVPGARIAPLPAGRGWAAVLRDLIGEGP